MILRVKRKEKKKSNPYQLRIIFIHKRLMSKGFPRRLIEKKKQYHSQRFHTIYKQKN